MENAKKNTSNLSDSVSTAAIMNRIFDDYKNLHRDNPAKKIPKQPASALAKRLAEQHDALLNHLYQQDVQQWIEKLKASAEDLSQYEAHWRNRIDTADERMRTYLQKQLEAMEVMQKTIQDHQFQWTETLTQHHENVQASMQNISNPLKKLDQLLDELSTKLSTIHRAAEMFHWYLLASGFIGAVAGLGVSVLLR